MLHKTYVSILLYHFSLPISSFFFKVLNSSHFSSPTAFQDKTKLLRQMNKIGISFHFLPIKISSLCIGRTARRKFRPATQIDHIEGHRHPAGSGGRSSVKVEIITLQRRSVPKFEF